MIDKLQQMVFRELLLCLVSMQLVLCSQEVALILAKMPQLSQPAPPPGIPPGIAPQRRPIAKSSDFTEVRSRQPKVVEGNEPCKFFAQGSCFRGDSCYYAHVDPADSASVPVSSEDYITRRTHAGPQETPPVCVSACLSVLTFSLEQDLGCRHDKLYADSE